MSVDYCLHYQRVDFGLALPFSLLSHLHLASAAALMDFGATVVPFVQQAGQDTFKQRT
jgi:hypothetical protein